MDWKLELVAVPVTDVDRAKAFYVDQVGFNADHDHQVSDEMRFVQLTPPGSACSIAIGTGIMETVPARCRACSSSSPMPTPLARTSSGTVSRSARSRTSPGAGSCSSRIRTGTAGPCRRSSSAARAEVALEIARGVAVRRPGAQRGAHHHPRGQEPQVRVGRELGRQPAELERRDEQQGAHHPGHPARRQQEHAGAAQVDPDADAGQPVRDPRRVVLQQEADPAAVISSAKAGSMWPTRRWPAPRG